MQEEIEQKVLALIINGAKTAGKITAAPIKLAIRLYLDYRRELKLQKRLQKSNVTSTSVTPKGKQTVKQLIGQNQGVSSLEITDPSIKDFERIARKYGVDYAVKKDRSSSPPKYLVFFKARDADALTAAFSDYTGRKVKKAERAAQKAERPSVLEKLERFKAQARATVRTPPVRNLPVR